jgi:hypothetical protein
MKLKQLIAQYVVSLRQKCLTMDSDIYARL